MPVTARLEVVAFVAIRFVVVALVNVAWAYESSVPESVAIVPSAASMALVIVPAMLVPLMEPPVIVAPVIVVPLRLSMRCESAMLLTRPPLEGRELGMLVSDAEREKIWLDSLLSS